MSLELIHSTILTRFGPFAGAVGTSHKKKKGEKAATREHIAGFYEADLGRKNSYNGIIITSNVLSALGFMVFSVKYL